MAICAKCGLTRSKDGPSYMRCTCDVERKFKARRLKDEGKEPEPGKINIGGVEKTMPKGGFRIKNGKVKSNITRNRAARRRKQSLLKIKIKELNKSRKNFTEPSDLEELDALILNLQQELNEL